MVHGDGGKNPGMGLWEVVPLDLNKVLELYALGWIVMNSCSVEGLNESN